MCDWGRVPHLLAVTASSPRATTAASSLRRCAHLLREEGPRVCLAKGQRRAAEILVLNYRASRRSLDAARSRPGRLLRYVNGSWGSLDEFLVSLSSRRSPFLPGASGPRSETVAALLRDRLPGNLEATVRAAERACRHEFGYLGHETAFSGEIDWHLDPESGRSWPTTYFEKLGRRVYSSDGFADTRQVWELNRHQHLVTLGKAYWLTGDERYAEEAAREIVSWVRHNPPGFGINWFSALEVGIRLISWTLAFQFLRSSSLFMELAAPRFLLSLHQQASFLRQNLTLDWEVRNNHILGETAALVVVASGFPDFHESSAWLKDGLRIFQKELDQQTFPDGANREQASGYHRFVVDLLTLVVVLERGGAFKLLPATRTTLEEMLTYLMYTAPPDRRWLLVGDCDDGRGYSLDESVEFTDFRESLAVGAVLFRRSDFKYLADRFTEGAIWLLGETGLRKFERLEATPPSSRSTHFVDAGHHIVRDDWSPESDFAFFKCGPFGLGGDGFCAHGHCDLLAFLLYISGQPIVVDSGTHSYHGPRRDLFRLTAAHNTLMVDGREQAVPRNEFSWVRVPESQCLRHDDKGAVGRMELPSGVEHERELRHTDSQTWEATDRLRGVGSHEVSWFFHLSPALRQIDSASLRSLRFAGSGGLRIEIVSPEGLQLAVRPGWFSPAYGTRLANSTVVATWRGELQPDGIAFPWLFRREPREVSESR